MQMWMTTRVWVIIDKDKLDAPAGKCETCGEYRFYQDQDRSWTCANWSAPLVEVETIIGENSEGNYLVQEAF